MRGVSPGDTAGALFLWHLSLVERTHRTHTHTCRVCLSGGPKRVMDVHTAKADREKLSRLK